MSRIILSSGQVNRYGYRILPEGIKLKNYKNNPVVIWSHNGYTMPIGKMTALKIEEGKLTGEIVYDEKDEHALKIKQKFEDGFLNTVSIGHDPITTSDDKKHLLKGQTRSTVTETELLEVSVVTIPGDPGAHLLSAESIDQNIPKLNLKIENIMEVNLIKIAKSLGLSETATETEILSAIEKINEKADQSQKLSIDSLMTLGKDKGLITDDNEATYRTLASNDFENTKALIDAAVKPTAEQTDEAETLSVQAILAAVKNGSNTDQTDDKNTFEYLSKNNPKELNRIRKEDPVKYAALSAAYCE